MVHDSSSQPQLSINAAQRPVAVVTGAGRRFGLWMTESLVAQGWHVVAITRKAPVVTQTHVDYVACDLLSESSVTQACEYLLQQYPSIDFLLHNASIFEKDRPDLYDDLFRIHMKAPALLNQLLGPALQRRTRATGNIIHITDIYVNNPHPEFALYCSTKAGAENLMVSFAKRLAPQIRVNAIQPGPVKFLPEHTPSDVQQVLSETLLAKEGGFEALEKAIYSILDNEYMTAAVLRVDGGRAMAR